MKQPRRDNVIPLPGGGPVTLGDVVAELRSLRELVERFVSQPQPECVWVTVSEAASLTFRTEAAIRKRCRTRGIGVRVNGKWRVDRTRLVTQKSRHETAIRSSLAA
jgi:hypothetical protein